MVVPFFFSPWAWGLSFVPMLCFLFPRKSVLYTSLAPSAMSGCHTLDRGTWLLRKGNRDHGCSARRRLSCCAFFYFGIWFRPFFTERLISKINRETKRKDSAKEVNAEYFSCGLASISLHFASQNRPEGAKYKVGGCLVHR